MIGLTSDNHHDPRSSVQIRVLGHLEASVDDHPVALGGAKQRAVLAMLGLEPNRTIPADRLIEGLWGEEPPQSAPKMVQNYIWRLRKALADGGDVEILTHGRGYELRIDRELVDVCRLERLVAEAGRAAAAGEPGGAAREALALFHGEPLSDLVDEPFAIAEIRRLEELRHRAAELAIDADLAAGAHETVVGEIDALLAENPWRERLHAQRMLALYRCGRQAEALEAYRHARQILVEEVGVEPQPELQRLHDTILRQDPSLDVEPVVVDLPRELDAAASPPLIGRAGPLRALRALWQRAAAGSGALVTLAGAYGMGKTRMAAELATEAHREDAAVIYAAGAGPPEATLAAIARTRDTRLPMLLVVDDADRAPAEVRRALREHARGLAGVPVLVLATGQEPAALARLEPQDAIALDPLGADAVRMIAGFYAPAAGGDAIPVEALLASSRGVAAQRPRGRERVGAARGDAPRGRASPIARPAAAATRARSRTSWRGASSSCSPRASAQAWSPVPESTPAGRWSAPTRAWRRSTPRTRSTSSGASGWSPSSSRGSSARRCSRSSALRAAASRRWSGRAAAGAGRRRPAGQQRVGAGADAARRAAAARAAPREPPARSRVARRAGRRPVRGAVHRL